MKSTFRHLIAAALALSLSSFACAAAFASGRVALVIGNGAYRNIPALTNPANDAVDVAAALKRLGFDTILATDQDKSGMEDAEIRFARAAGNADVAMFYYSGHALQFAGVNYLAPVDAQLSDTADLRRMVRVDDLVADLQRAKNLRILVLDSCRNNPLAEQLNRLLVATRGVQLERGLAKIDTPEGMIVAYSTQAGHVAYDGDDKRSRNSPYTRAFLKEIETRDEVGTIFRQVSADVYDATAKQQLPELSLSIIGKFYLNGAPELAPKPEDTAKFDFEAAKSLDTVGAWDAFLKQHPEGFYASLAKEWRAKAEAKLVATLPTAPAAAPATASKPASAGPQPAKSTPLQPPSTAASPTDSQSVRPNQIARQSPANDAVAPSTPSAPSSSMARPTNRIALVIGNAKYPDADKPLASPVNDARAIADELRRDGFAVDLGENLTRDGMLKALGKFYGAIKPGSVGLIFYSGFGIQSNRQSYLIPVDSQIWTESDVRQTGVKLEEILGEINNRGAGVKIALIDASGRNPFERRFRSFSAGLAPVIAPNGTLVMYSAALSSIVPDSDSDHSLFVQELLKEVGAPGLAAEETLNRTRVGVTRASRSEQVPWLSSSLAEDFSFAQR
jgi:uncharacterized caspase-like protein